MTGETPPLDAADEYRERIKRLAPKVKRTSNDLPPWPGLANLREFIELERQHPCTESPEISIINIPGDGSGFSITPPIWGHQDLSNQLPSLSNESPFSHLIIVEDLCPDTLALLGGTYDIDTQFFADHINVLSWYRMVEPVPERLPSLPSTKKAEDFLLLRYVGARELVLEEDAGSVLYPDMTKTRMGHSAGKMKPVSWAVKAFEPETLFPPMAFTRQTVSVWCRKKANGEGWIAIMLLDPPFPLKPSDGKKIGHAEYRNPNLRPKVNEEVDMDKTGQTFREAFCRLLEQRSADKAYLRTCNTDPFLIFYEGYRIIASEWLVVNEYVKRELANIERYLEKTESTFHELELLLKELYRIRRRCNKDHELATEAASQCEKRGQALWPSSKGNPNANKDTIAVAERHAQGLEEDFKFVLDNMTISIARIEKDIGLLMALVTISEGRQGLLENRGISFLTLIATLFLPSGTVASILGIQTQYGPGARNFWMLWAVALPLTIFVVMIPVMYPTVRPGLKQFLSKGFRDKVKVVELVDKTPNDLQDNGIELTNGPGKLVRHRFNGSVV